MNANSLWTGNDYAHSTHLRKGDKYVDGARRVRVIKITQKILPGNDKASTFVDVWFIDEETELPLDQNDVRQVRARDIFMRWEEYADERERRKVEYDKRVRERAEQERAAENKKQRIIEGLIEKGIPRHAIIECNDYNVRILTREIKAWLDPLNQSVETETEATDSVFS